MIWVLGIVLGLLQPIAAVAASKEEIDAGVQEAIENFYKHTSAGKRLAQKAAGMLVFSSVFKAGIGIGGEINTDTMQEPIIGFIFSNKGLMYNLTFEGSKMTRIER